MAFLNNNFNETITLGDAAKIAGMAEVSLSRFFKFRTGKTFIDTLNEVRLGHATRMLIDTTNSINEVAYKCGFNNMSNFNRIFKKEKRQHSERIQANLYIIRGKEIVISKNHSNVWQIESLLIL